MRFHQHEISPRGRIYTLGSDNWRNLSSISSSWCRIWWNFVLDTRLEKWGQVHYYWFIQHQVWNRLIVLYVVLLLFVYISTRAYKLVHFCIPIMRSRPVVEYTLLVLNKKTEYINIYIYIIEQRRRQKLKQIFYYYVLNNFFTICNSLYKITD